MSRRKTKNDCPLIIEPHPPEYDGYPFITLIQYSNDQELLTIIDNSNNKSIAAFVLDLCGPEKINEQHLIDIASEWYYTGHKDEYPLSIEFSRREISKEMSKIFRIYTIDFVTRVIGPLPVFNMTDKPKIKRRRRKGLPKGIAIRTKSLIE
jgi:hypothetical protein